MPPPPGVSPIKSGKEVRAEVRRYIHEERDTVLMKWLTLGETVKSVDRTRDQFEMKQQKKVKALPMNIQKFIGTIKRCVRRVIKKKGGTPYSIVRNLFMYWGASGTNPSGTLDCEQLKKCMTSLQVEMTQAELEEVVVYYATNKLDVLAVGDDNKRSSNSSTAGIVGFNAKTAVISYDDILTDIAAGEPTVVMDTGTKYFDEADDIGVRFKERDDEFSHMPQIVVQFIEATQNYVLKLMRALGGTPHQHVREFFTKFDLDQSNGLDEDELVLACRKSMQLIMSRDQAREVVKFYDRTRTGQFNYNIFLKDVTKGTKPILHFTEITAEDRQKTIKSLSTNPLIPKPFQTRPNKILEYLKLQLKGKLGEKVAGGKGGRLTSWLTEAFQSYDKGGSHTLSNWKDIQGAMLRAGVPISKETAEQMIRSYDLNSTGQMHYKLFIKDIESEDMHFLKTDARSPKKEMMSTSATARTPSNVTRIIQLFKTSCEIFSRKSSGKLAPRDLLYGTCLRFDTDKSGRIPPFAVMNVAKALNLNVRQDDVNALIDWFDTNATHTLDYNTFTKQLYGNDVMNATLILPKLHKDAGKADFHDEVRYISGYRPSPSEASDDIDMSHSTVFASGLIENASSPKQKRPKQKKVRNRDNPNYTPLKRHSDDPIGGVGKDGELNPIAESPAQQDQRLKYKRELVLKERTQIAEKLKQVESMRRQLSDDFTKRRNAVHEAEILKKHQAEYAQRQAQRNPQQKYK